MEPVVSSQSSNTCLCRQAAPSAEEQGAIISASIFADYLSGNARDSSFVELTTELKAKKRFSLAYDAAARNITDTARRMAMCEELLLAMVEDRVFEGIYPISQGMAIVSTEADRKLATIAGKVSEAAQFALAMQIIDLISDPYAKLEALAQLATQLYKSNQLNMVTEVGKKFYAVLTSPEIIPSRLQEPPYTDDLKRGIKCFVAASQVEERLYKNTLDKFAFYPTFNWNKSDYVDTLGLISESLIKRDQFSEAVSLIENEAIEDRLKLFVNGAQIVIQKKNWVQFDEFTKKIKTLPIHNAIVKPFETLALSLAAAGEKEKAVNLALSEIAEKDLPETLATLGSRMIESDSEFAGSLVTKILSLSYKAIYSWTKYRFGISLIKAGKTPLAKALYEQCPVTDIPYAGIFDEFLTALFEANEDEYIAKMQLPQHFNFDVVVKLLSNNHLFSKALGVAKNFEKDRVKRNTELLYVLSKMSKAGLLHAAQEEVKQLLGSGDPDAGQALILICSEMVKEGKHNDAKILIQSYIFPDAQPFFYRKIASVLFVSGQLDKLVAFCKAVSPSLLPEFEAAAALTFQKKKLESDEIMENIPVIMIREKTGSQAITEGLRSMTLKEQS